jgi:hypothetical protein
MPACCPLTRGVSRRRRVVVGLGDDVAAVVQSSHPDCPVQPGGNHPAPVRRAVDKQDPPPVVVGRSAAVVEHGQALCVGSHSDRGDRAGRRPERVAAARRGSQDDHHGRAALDRGTAEQRHRVRVGGATSPVGTSCLGRPPKGAMLATTVTVRMRPARSTCNTALSAASLTYQPSTPSQTTSSGVLASSDRRRGWRLAGRRLGRPPARQSSAAMLSPRSRAGRVADHHAHPHRRRPWPPRSARPGRRAAGRCRGSTAAGRAASRAGRRPSRLRHGAVAGALR